MDTKTNIINRSGDYLSWTNAKKDTPIFIKHNNMYVTGVRLEERSAVGDGLTGTNDSRSYELVRTPYGLKISYRWFRSSNIFLFVFFLIWTIPFVFALSFLLEAAISSGELDWGLLFLIPFIAFGSIFLYWGLANLINKTVIDIQGGKIKISHHPLPWFGTREFSTADVEQVYVRDQATERTFTGKIVELRTLMMKLRDGKKVKLVRSIDSSDSARYLESIIESTLRICDKRVEGECFESVTDRAMKQIEWQEQDMSSMTKAHLSMTGTLNPSWSLTSYEDGRTIASFVPRKGIGLNRPLLITATIVVGLFTLIYFLASSSSDGVPFQLFFLPVVCAVILLFAYRTMGTRIYTTENGMFQYRSRRAKGALNSIGFDCIDVNDRTCHFKADSGVIQYNDGDTYRFVSGASLRVAPRGANILRADLRDVSVILFRGTSEENTKPIVVIKDESGPKTVQATVYLTNAEGKERQMEQLTGFAVQIFHLYKTNLQFSI